MKADFVAFRGALPNLREWNTPKQEYKHAQSHKRWLARMARQGAPVRDMSKPIYDAEIGVIEGVRFVVAPEKWCTSDNIDLGWRG